MCALLHVRFTRVCVEVFMCTQFPVSVLILLLLLPLPLTPPHPSSSSSPSDDLDVMTHDAIIG